ncbi:MAG TPA: hypothetical protein VHS99_15340, partial [Chloroflexota bacterium]|nr:hypothetical protein [Chloroflexota bacterium]
MRLLLQRPWLLPVCCLSLPLLVYGRFIVLGDELANADVFLAYRPAHAWLAEGLRQGRVPLWNPFILGGFPLAFSEYGWFSPLNWIPLLLAGPHAGFYLAVACYVALSTASTYVLGRSWGLPPLPAWLGAAVYGQSLYVVGGAPLLNQGATYWTLPATLWLVQRHVAGGHALAAPLLALAMALALVGGHPQLVLLTSFPAALAALVLAVTTGRLWRLMPLVLAGLTAAGLSAVRYVPTLPLIEASERSGGLSFTASAIGSVHPLALLTGMLLPSLNVPLLPGPQWSVYVGFLPLLLAGAGAGQAWRRGGAPRMLTLLGALGLVLALGSFTPLYWLIRYTPLLAYFREPSRFLLWTVLAVAVLAAFGLDRLASLRSEFRVPGPGSRVGRELGTRNSELGTRLWRVAAGAWLAAVVIFGAAQLLLRANTAWLVTTGRMRVMTQFRSGDYPLSFYIDSFDAAWRQLLQATNPLHPGLALPLLSIGAGLWWWRWGRGRPRAVVTAMAVAILPLMAYGQVRLPAIPAAVVREVPASAAALRPPDGGSSEFRVPGSESTRNSEP